MGKKCKKMMDDMVKKMTICDIKMIKLSVFFFTLFLVGVWPGFRNLVVNRIGWWWFLILGIVCAAAVLKRTCKGACKKPAAKKKK